MTHIARTAKPRRAGGGLAFTILAALGLGLLAAGFVGVVLWPRQLASIVSPDAPSVPITVAGVAFNIPPAAIRVPLQRRPGAQERVDLAFLWPSLQPPDPAARPSPTDEPKALDRLFVTIAVGDGTLTPIARAMTIYPRFITGDAVTAPGGLVALAFRDGSPYHGEDLIFDPSAPEAFLVRCSRPGAAATPGICLIERRIGAADIIMRFPRDWLADWQSVARGIDRLIASLRPPGR